MHFTEFLRDLLVILAGAKVCGEVAVRLRQPAVLGELLGGVVVGVSVLRLIHPHDPTIRNLAELGALVLLFEIGLACNLRDLLKVGARSLVLGVAGIVLPFVAGYLVMAARGEPALGSVFVGAALTATSIGITARVLADLGALGTKEANIVIGAAVVDDILGIVILSVVEGLGETGAVHPAEVARIAGLAIGFVVVAIVLGQVAAGRLVGILRRMRSRGVLIVGALGFAFALALGAHAVGSATIVGAFTAGLILARTEPRVEIEHALKPIADLLVPVFFVSVGAEVDIRLLNPLIPENRPALALAGILAAVAIATKWAAGFVVPGRGLRRVAIGAAMVPRGEVGLIFADIGRRSGLFDDTVFGAILLMIMITTFVGP
ncbi:MAG TPA: cation:proton antiporter, partial [Planctomycetota bacterium]|nr:cation:proton antiporter [Planctomycetota bacterium]